MTSRRSIKVSLMLGLFLGLFSLLQEANAQVPRSISYQGRLIKNNVPFEGTVNMQIKIYDASGQELYTESYTGVTVSQGIFNVQLGGMDNHLPGYLKFDQQYFLGINVDGTGELTPRTAFVAAPYALNAQTVGGFGVSAVPTAGMLLPLDANGKIPASVLPQAAQDVTTINNVTGDGAGNINLTSSNNSIAIVPNAATNSIDLTITSMPSGFDATNIVIGAGLGGGPILPGSDTISIFVKDNGITTSMLGTGVVTGIKLDQFVAGNGLRQDALGNLEIDHDATLILYGPNPGQQVLGINLSNPNTWLALQTFNAGITVNGTTTLNGPVNISGPVTIFGTPEPNASTDPVGVTAWEEIINGDLNVDGFTYLEGNTRINGIVDLRNTILNTGGDVTVGDNMTLNGNLTHNGNTTHTGNTTQTGDYTSTGTITHTGAIGNTGDITNTGGLTNTGNATFNVSAGADAVTVNGNPEPLAVNNGAVAKFEVVDNGDMRVTGFFHNAGNAQFAGNTTTVNNTLDAQGAINNTSGNNGGAVFVNDAFTVGNGNPTSLTGSLTVNGNSSLLGATNTIGTAGSSVNTITGANNTYTATGLHTFNGNVLMNNNFTLMGTNNVYGVDARPGAGPISNNQFNGINFFGNIGVNGNKVLINGLATLGAPIAPGGFPAGFSSPADFEGVVNGDFQITGFTHMNNATVNGTLMVNGAILSPGATVCFNTVQVQTLTSWCSAPGSAITVGTAFSQSSLGASASNSFLATTIAGGNVLTATGNIDAQSSIINTTANNAGAVNVNDDLAVQGLNSLYGPAGGGGVGVVANPISINPPIGNENTPNAKSTFRSHASFIGTSAGFNERKVFVHGVPEGPGAATPNNSIPPVTNFEVEIVGDLYVQGTIVGGGIPQIQSYTVTLNPATPGPNGGASVTFSPAGGYDANDAVHMSYTSFGVASGILAYDSPAAGQVRIESSSALDTGNLRVTVIRYVP